jgi:ankyrin repeat protein
LKQPEIKNDSKKTALLKYKQAGLSDLNYKYQIMVAPHKKLSNTKVRDEFIDAIQENNLNFINPRLGATPLIYAVRDDNILILLKLLQSTIDLNERYNRLLVIAARSSNTLILKLLLEFGADPNLPNRSGDYPLNSTISYRQPAQMHVLLSYQADPNLKDNNGQTPYMRAYKMKDKIYMQLLEAKGADTGLPK